MLINFELIKEEIKFFMDYHLGFKEDIEKLINLEDSMFYSEQSR